jgi:hypothetical protein
MLCNAPRLTTTKFPKKEILDPIWEKPQSRVISKQIDERYHEYFYVFQVLGAK